MRTIAVIFLGYVLALTACLVSTAKLLDVVAIGTLASFGQYHGSSFHPTLVERRQMEAARSRQPAGDARPQPIRALIAPDLPANVLAARLDAAESAEAPPLLERAWRSEPRRGQSSCHRHCRVALERRLENLE